MGRRYVYLVVFRSVADQAVGNAEAKCAAPIETLHDVREIEARIARQHDLAGAVLTNFQLLRTEPV